MSPQLLAGADMFCQPKQGPEPFGIVFMEALWAGCPVVTTAMGGALEILDESCGILAEPDSPDSLAAALDRLIQSPELARPVGAGGASSCSAALRAWCSDARFGKTGPRARSQADQNSGSCKISSSGARRGKLPIDARLAASRSGFVSLGPGGGWVPRARWNGQGEYGLGAIPGGAAYAGAYCLL